MFNSGKVQKKDKII